MIPHIRIRNAEIQNAKLLANIIRASHMDVAEKFNLSLENCPKHPSNCAADWIEKDFERGVRYYIFEQSGIPKGCIALEHASADICYIERLSVLREYRSNGYGKKLVIHATDAAKDLGVKEIGIGTIVAGIVVAFSIVVMPGIKTLSDRDYLQSFAAMDRVIQDNQPVFMLVWIGSVLALAVTTWFGTLQLEGMKRALIV